MESLGQNIRQPDNDIHSVDEGVVRERVVRMTARLFMVIPADVRHGVVLLVGVRNCRLLPIEPDALSFQPIGSMISGSSVTQQEFDNIYLAQD